jgi:4-alpha-glucanotransferase
MSPASRHCGVLLHPTSLPGPHGSGDLGPAAFHFVDWLATAGQDLWQMLPLVPVGPGNSPYASASAFAGSPLLIALEPLTERGWLDRRTLAEAAGLRADRVDFARVIPWRMGRLRETCAGFALRASAADRADLAAFCNAHAHWLDDHALFMALDAHYAARGIACWTQWADGHARRHDAALANARVALASEIEFQRFVQWCFQRQWEALRQHAAARGVRLIGDLPIFVAHHSADCWAHQPLFRLDAAGEPTVVAGVPPDYFSATGQRWGNPLYDWQAMQRDGFAWWVARLRHELARADLVRIDHFRGFAACWEIPATCPTAIDGRWVEAPGAALFEAARNTLGPLALIAEDLGVITPAVDALREAFDLPGMKVLQFAFSGPDNAFLPHEHVPHAIVYTGTHDNDPVLGWWQHLASAGEKELLAEYAGTTITEPNWTLIRLGLASCAHTFITTMPDVLGLGREARFNLPGAESGNWSWRLPEGVFEHPAGGRLARLTWVYRRAPGQKAPARQEPEPPAPGGFA